MHKTQSQWKLWCWHGRSKPTWLSTSVSMITITSSIAISVITIIIITITIFIISDEMNTPTYTNILLDAGRRFHWKPQIRDVLFLRSHCLQFLRNIMMQWSIPWWWGILRSCGSGGTKIHVQIMISTKAIILATAMLIPHPGSCNSTRL